MVLVASHITKVVWVVFGSSPGGWFFVYLPEKLATNIWKIFSRKLFEIIKLHLAIFIASMFTRTKVQREHFRKNWENVIRRMEEMKSVMKNNPDRKILPIEHGDGPSFTLDEIKKHMEDFDTDESISVITSTADMAPILFDMNWQILKAPTDKYFICSDNPLCMCSPKREKLYGRNTMGAQAGLGHNDVELTFPLSKEFAVVISWNGPDLIYLLDTPSELIDQINYRTLRTASNLIANDKGILEEIVTKAKK